MYGFKVDGGWGQYSSDGPCSTSCGGGIEHFTRDCNNPTPAHNGADCQGSPTKTENCNEQPCPGWIPLSIF